MLEIEIKARWRRGEEGLLGMGAEFTGEERQKDVYFNHPSRDFRETDEALRIRDSNGSLELAYKGPRRDSETKTREELEAPASRETFVILERLGFRKAAVVRKTRRNFNLEGVKLSIDEVEGLDTFIEIETDGDGGKGGLFAIMERLGIAKEKTITESYLELLEDETH